MYYCTFLNREAGPFTREEIYTLIREGQLQKKSLITCEGETRAAEDWPEFKVLFIVTDRTVPTEESQNSYISKEVPQTGPPASHKSLFLLFIKVLSILYILFGILMIYCPFDEMTHYHERHAKCEAQRRNGEFVICFHDQKANINCFLYSLVVFSVSGIITVTAIKDLYKSPKNNVGKMAWVGLAMIVVNGIFGIFPLMFGYELIHFGFGGLVPVFSFIVNIPYTIIMGITAYCLRE